MKTLYLWLGMMCLTILSVAQIPENLNNFSAHQRNKAVELTWNEIDAAVTKSFEIEKSSNGRNFKPIGTVLANELKQTGYTYRFVDAAPENGPNYYRLKRTGIAGDITYSSVVKINMGYGKTVVKIIPNPVQKGIVYLQLENLKKGKYTVNIFSSIGQRVFVYAIDHTGGSATQTLNLPQNIGPGMYTLQLTDGKVRYNRQLLVK